jgi:hypothetical protein
MAQDFFYSRARYTEVPFRPYVIAVGQTALAWNDLHEYLGRFFGMFSIGKTRAINVAVWQSQRVDRNKRQMLDAAVKAAPDTLTEGRPQLKPDLIWLLNRVDALEDLRNDVVHAPLHLAVDLEKISPTTRPARQSDFLRAARTEPMEIGDNFRAKKLSGRDLLLEYRRCRDSLTLLRNFIREIDDSISEGKPWPNRPRLPTQQASKKAPADRGSAQG